MSSANATQAVGACPCGATFEPDGWAALGVIERLEADEVRELTADWLESDCIEIRRCPECALGILAKISDVRAPSPHG